MSDPGQAQLGGAVRTARDVTGAAMELANDIVSTTQARLDAASSKVRAARAALTNAEVDLRDARAVRTAADLLRDHARDLT